MSSDDLLKLHNLNHLVPLWALLTTANVSHAANTAGMAQPTMSKILLSLREELGDRLLIREGNSMRLTPFAQGLLPRVHLAIEHIKSVYDRSEDFDPLKAGATIKVGANDYVIATLGIPWLRRLRQKAPRVSLDFRPVGMVFPEQLLSSDSLDIALGPQLPNMNLRQQFLFEDPFVCVADGGNTSIPNRLTLDEFTGYRHIDISPTGTGLTRIWLEKTQPSFKKKRQISHSLSMYLTLPEVIKDTDDLAIVPRNFLKIAPPGSLREVALDFKLPVYAISAWWHNRLHNDLVLQWAKNELLGLVQELFHNKSLRP